jgi:hypothetical protein
MAKYLLALPAGFRNRIDGSMVKCLLALPTNVHSGYGAIFLLTLLLILSTFSHFYQISDQFFLSVHTGVKKLNLLYYTF